MDFLTLNLYFLTFFQKGDVMKFLYGAPDATHEKGEFCLRAKYDYFSFYYFSTPFLYEKDGKLLEGEAGEIIANAPEEVVYHGPVSPDENFTNDWLHVGGSDLSELMKKYPIPSGVRLKHNNPLLIKNVAKSIRRELALPPSHLPMKKAR